MAIFAPTIYSVDFISHKADGGLPIDIHSPQRQSSGRTPYHAAHLSLHMASSLVRAQVWQRKWCTALPLLSKQQLVQTAWALLPQLLVP